MRKSVEPRIVPSQITSQSVYLQRRKLLAALGLGAAAWSVGHGAAAVAAVEPGRATDTTRPARPGRVRVGQPTFSRNARYRSTEPLTSFEDATTYNNFYEFGTDKTDPRERAGSLRPEPWSVELAGECEARGRLTLEDVLKPHALEERIYRFRCVEAWSMVVPWLGFPLADLIRRARPTSRAKYVEFTTLLDPAQMPGQRTGLLDWPYVEGLRMDEAMHPLAFIAVGLYGQWLPNQNGAPLRLVVPWKYGFKSIKSIVRLRFVEREPRTTWNVMAADEYGFYANVNPAVDHPRWSQARERRLGSNIFAPRIETLPFNGYANDVAGLYRGMDLTRYY